MVGLTPGALGDNGLYACNTTRIYGGLELQFTVTSADLTGYPMITYNNTAIAGAVNGSLSPLKEIPDQHT